ncbi:hypothetical protein IEO21_05644 [Rhodonia placenta]|uniref:Uncharacterized protein n=1 Tax=Rhodonia placenta TaxID=104341 RepID=A0A8H7U236_9APHY|nr:hypothetical protein IEO21_05644 [Postia placenta]
MNTVDIDGPASIPLPLSPSPDQLQCHNISLYPDVVLRDPVDENYARSTDSELATSREDLTGKDTETVLLSDERAAENFIDKHVSRHTGGRSSTSTPPSRPSSAASHGRLLTISKGHTVSVVVTSSALETIAASREAKRSALLRESVQRALQLVNAGQGRDRPHVWHARLAMRNPFLPVLIICPSLSPTHPSWIFVGCPASTLSASVTGSYKLPTISLADAVVHTIPWHPENTPETMSLQIAKACSTIQLNTDFHNPQDEVDSTTPVVAAGPGLLGALANVGRDLQKEANVMRSNYMTNKAEVGARCFLKRLMRSQRKGSRPSEPFFSAPHLVHDTGDLDIVEMGLDGFKNAIRVVCCNNPWLGVRQWACSRLFEYIAVTSERFTELKITIRQRYEIPFLRDVPASFHRCADGVVHIAVTFSVNRCIRVTIHRTPVLIRHRGFPKAGDTRYCPGLNIRSDMRDVYIRYYGGLAPMCTQQRMWMARIYAPLSIVTALATVGTDLFRVIVDFVLKNELIDECTKIAQSDTDFKRFVFWGPTFETKLNQSEASTHCHNDWNLRSSLEITIFILDALGVALSSSLVLAWAYHLHESARLEIVTRPSGREDACLAHYKPPSLAYNGYNNGDGAKLYGGAKPSLYSQDVPRTLGKNGTYIAVARTDPFENLEGNHGEKDDMK